LRELIRISKTSSSVQCNGVTKKEERCRNKTIISVAIVIYIRNKRRREIIS